MHSETMKLQYRVYGELKEMDIWVHKAEPKWRFYIRDEN
jgi:hypothetical protein